jgi:hypothetical protein
VGYYTRVLTQHPYCIHFNNLVAHIDREGWRAELVIEDGTPTNWEQLALSHTGGDEIAIIERNSVENSGLGAEEIDEFISEIQACKPKSAAAWLIEYLRSVKTIYSFQHLHGATHSNGDQILRSISNLIWSQGRAILQADGEGFSNEEGYHILWQFPDDVTGAWWMAVLENGHWISFEMDLGSKEQREAFLAGGIPSRAEA